MSRAQGFTPAEFTLSVAGFVVTMLLLAVLAADAVNAVVLPAVAGAVVALPVGELEEGMLVAVLLSVAPVPVVVVVSETLVASAAVPPQLARVSAVNAKAAAMD